MATLTCTYTKTFALLDDWAATIPNECKGCGKPHVHVHDPCAVPSCAELLRRNEQVYAVLQAGGPDAPEPVPCEVNPALTTAQCHHAEQWVCWRHIRPDDGPIRTS